MKKPIVLFSLLLAFCLQSEAQYYYSAHVNAGQNPGNLNQDSEYPVGGGLAAGWTTLTDSALTPAWSPTGTIPFSFNFNDTVYTQYKVSTSGVLTFNLAAVTPPSYTRTTIPAPTIPNNSVLVWGIKGTGTNDYIVTKTFGIAPNRQHWILFDSYTAAGGCAIYWAIVLEETTNKIYIVDMRNTGCGVGLTLGIQFNGTTALKVFGSPNYPQYAGSDATSIDNTYYEFTEGSLPAADIQLNTLTNARWALPGSNVNVTGKITNLGTTPVTSFTIKYENAGNIYSYTKTGVSLASYQPYSFTHSIPFNIANPVAYPIKVWVEYPGDVDQNNDTLNTFVSGLSFTPLKNIVFEEFTGTWCGYCPRGTVYMDSLRTLHPDRAMLIAVHDGDVMNLAEYDLGIAIMSAGAPDGFIDRKQLNVDPDQFVTGYNSQINVLEPCEISVTSDFNPSNRQLTIVVSSLFAGDLVGDYRFNAVVTESGVTGTGDGTNTNNLDYDQENYYSFQSLNMPLVGAGRNWQTALNPVDAPLISYDNVARAILGGFKGLEASLPSYINGNTTYSHTFVYTVPVSYNVNKLKVIGWVCDGATKEILNSNKTDNVLGVPQQASNPHHLVIFPNPSTGIISIKSAFNLNSIMKVNVLNSLGEKVLSFDNMNFNTGQTLDLSKQSNGLYFIQFTDEKNGTSVSKVMINR